MPAVRTYPTADGIGAAIQALQPIKMRRTAATTGLPVLLALQHELAAGRVTRISVEGTDFDVVPNSAVRELVDDWFGVEDSDEGAPYFVPMPLPGAASPHWRDRGLVAQSIFTSLLRHGWGAERR